MKPKVLIIPANHAPFSPPKDSDDITPLMDISEGGIALSDGTHGLQVQFWTFTIEGEGLETGIYLEAPNYPKTLQLAISNLTWVRGTFDQNMHPAVAFVAGGFNYLWWWDPVVHAQTITELAPTILSPTVLMDDTRARETQLGNNDIILAYLIGSEVFYRLQRDRYGVQYPWYSGIFPDYIEKPYINRMGINLEWRFQLEFHDRIFDYPE